MSARRFFVEGVHASGEGVEIVGSDAHKILHVLRLRGGDRIEVIDSTAHEFVATLDIDRETVRAVLGARVDSVQTSHVHADVAQGLPKGSKMDFVVEKLTELGVSTIYPLVSERAVVRDVGASKIERWRRLAKTAAQQCGRNDLPIVTAPLTFDELLGRFGDYDRVLLAWEAAPVQILRDELPQAIAGCSRLLIAIGPEGGFSHAEANAAQDAGARLISLGTRILRTETAALVLLALVNYLSG